MINNLSDLITKGKDILKEVKDRSDIQVVTPKYCAKWVECCRQYLKSINEKDDYSLRRFQTALNTKKSKQLNFFRKSEINNLIAVLESIEEIGISNLEDVAIKETRDDTYNILIRMLNNFNKYAIQLKKAQKGRENERNKMRDEADVQDALHSILKLYFNDVRKEYFIGENSGSNSRVDFFIKDINVYLEVKYATQNLSNKNLGEQIASDIQRYNDESGRRILFFIYD